MFRSVFTRYIVSFILIFVLSFCCFGAIIYGYVYEYARKNMSASVQNAAYSAKRSLDVLYQSFVERKLSEEEGLAGLPYGVPNGQPELTDDNLYNEFYESERLAISAVVDGIAKFSDVGVLITNGEGTILIASVKSIEADSLPGDFAYYDRTSEDKIAVEGLTEEKVFVCSMTLSGQDNPNYVLTYNLADTERIMLGKLSQGMAVSAIVVFLLGFAGCYMISFGIISPLRDMSKAAKKFAKGDFSARVEVRGKDEIAELGTSFNNMAKALAELDQQRSTFLQNVSHDLRTPMTSISGFIDGILDGTIKENERDHYLNIVSVEVKRLSRLVRTLLEVTRLEAGARKFTMTDFDAAEMAMMILFSFEKQIDERKLNVDVDLSKDHFYVKADSDAIYQVLYNLIDNAVKFSYDKGALQVKMYEQGKRTVIEVFNEGKGIESEDLPHVFDRFYKADKSRGLDKSGVGLGLFIVKAIIQAHDGNVVAESEEGRFCRFRLDLPTGEMPSPEKRRAADRQ